MRPQVSEAASETFNWTGGFNEVNVGSDWGNDKLKTCQMNSATSAVKLAFELCFPVCLILNWNAVLFSMLLFRVDQKADQEPDTNECVPGSE